MSEDEWNVAGYFIIFLMIGALIILVTTMIGIWLE